MANPIEKHENKYKTRQQKNPKYSKKKIKK